MEKNLLINVPDKRSGPIFWIIQVYLPIIFTLLSFLKEITQVFLSKLVILLLILLYKGIVKIHLPFCYRFFPFSSSWDSVLSLCFSEIQIHWVNTPITIQQLHRVCWRSKDTENPLSDWLNTYTMYNAENAIFCSAKKGFAPLYKLHIFLD